VLAGLGVALAVPLAALHRMEEPFERLERHELSERTALHLRDAAAAVREAARKIVDEPATPTHAVEAALAELRDVSAALQVHVSEPRAAAHVPAVLAAIGALERALVEEVIPAARAADPRAAAAYAAAAAPAHDAQRALHALITDLHTANAGYRQQLIALESDALRWTIVVALLAPILLGAAAVHLSRSVALPLARIADDAARIAAGDLDHRIDIETADEFGALAERLNAMTSALRRDRERLVESETLAGVGRLAAGVAHELNNPLQVILGYLSLHRDVGDERLAVALRAIEEEAHRCREIVEALLESSRRRVSSATVDLRALCDDVVAALHLAGPRAPRIHVEGSGLAWGDRSKLRRVVLNLAKNAVEAAGPGGRVELVARTDGGVAEVRVRDSGPGIAPETRARLFEPFFTTKESGTGLGLSVSRAIALAHGGDIDVESDEGGSTFTLRLPCPRGAGATEGTWNARVCSS
jgi:signal transduction histidine kinase